jgi:stress-induced morphogen
MSISINRGKTDERLEQIRGALEHYQQDHPDARIDLYRKDAFSVRVRIIDPRFRKMSRTERHSMVWRYLDSLPDEAVADVSMLVLIAPSEAKTSGANLEFEDPFPSES